MIASQSCLPTDQVTIADYDLDLKRNPIPVLFSARTTRSIKKEATKQVKHVLINTSYEPSQEVERNAFGLQRSRNTLPSRRP